MIKVLFHNFEFLYAAFLSSTITGDQLVPLFYEALMRVVATTLDGTSINRHFCKLIGTGPVVNEKVFHLQSSFILKKEIFLLLRSTSLVEDSEKMPGKSNIKNGGKCIIQNNTW
jgi:hypothetical protein